MATKGWDKEINAILFTEKFCRFEEEGRVEAKLLMLPDLYMRPPNVRENETN